jgi:hypothetical protein
MKFFILSLLISSLLTSTAFAGGYGHKAEPKIVPDASDFYYGPELYTGCLDYYQNTNPLSRCISKLSGVYLPKKMSKAIIRECLETKTNKIDQDACIKKYSGKFYPENMKCDGVSMDVCYNMYKDQIIDFPLKPKAELLQEIETNFKAGNYARARTLLGTITGEESEDLNSGCSDAAAINGSRIQKLNIDIDNMKTFSGESKTIGK